MSLSTKQSQEVASGDAYQSGRDTVVYHGLQLSEVKEVCMLYLEQNFPKLREEAMKESIAAVEKFSGKLFENLASVQDKILDEKLTEKLTSAEIQSSINDAVMSCARRGKSSSPDILCEMVSEKIININEDENEEKSLIFSEAIRITEKLSNLHMLLIGYIYISRNAAFDSEDKEEQYRVFYQDTIPRFFSQETIGKVSIVYLNYLGVLNTEMSYTKNIAELICKRTNYEFAQKNISELPIKAIQDDRYRPFFDLIDAFGYENISEFNRSVLSPLGDAIAIAYLRAKGMKKLSFI